MIYYFAILAISKISAIALLSFTESFFLCFNILLSKIKKNCVLQRVSCKRKEKSKKKLALRDDEITVN